MSLDRDKSIPEPRPREADDDARDTDDRHEKRPEGPYKDVADEREQAKTK